MPKSYRGVEPVKGVSTQIDSQNFNLSPQECQIIASIVAGYTNRDMARQFSLNVSTIFRRTHRLLGKLGVANKFELVLYAISHGIVTGIEKNQA